MNERRSPDTAAAVLALADAFGRPAQFAIAAHCPWGAQARLLVCAAPEGLAAAARNAAGASLLMLDADPPRQQAGVARVVTPTATGYAAFRRELLLVAPELAEGSAILVFEPVGC